MKRLLEGWLFDIDDLGAEVALWVYSDKGELVRLTNEFHQPIYAEGANPVLEAFAREFEKRGIARDFRRVEKQEFWSGKTISVLQCRVVDSSLMPKLRTLAATLDQQINFYNIDIPAAQYFLYLKKLFPLCKLVCEIDGDNRILNIEATDSPWDADYKLPELRTLKMWSESLEPLSSRSKILLGVEGKCFSLLLKDGARAIQSFNGIIKKYNPDVMISERGDSRLMPALLRLASRERLDLLIDRQQVVTKRRIVTEGRTFFSYGRALYKGPAYPLLGRWHIDARDSFLHQETSIDGLIELARLAKVPVQRMARTSPGSAMTSMEMDRAVQDDILIPWHKSEPESYKTGLELLTIDKGGLTFQPPVGAFENIVEIDFASMYPSIMVKHNISPETVLCGCCQNSVVPEANYNVCEKREGLIARTLAPVIARRRQQKEMIKGCRDARKRETLDMRRTAIKWMLVSCFGYLGYKNARFGRVEAHEAVTAFGREKLLQAKEIAEARGFQVLHALTDSLWLKRRSFTHSELLALCNEITAVTQIEMSLEGVYRWIEFLPSKLKATRPVPARYFGVFYDGNLKVRGLVCRRSDTPKFIKEVQLQMLEVIRKARNLDERKRLAKQAEHILETAIAKLESRVVGSGQLAMNRTLTREPATYKSKTRTAIAAEQLMLSGIPVHPGESVAYVITDTKAKDKSKRVSVNSNSKANGYDASEYIRLLKIAAAEVI
jgi:DNA polymerase II